MHKNLKYVVLFSSVVLYATSCSEAPKSEEAQVGEEQAVAVSNAGTSYTVDTSASQIMWVGTKVTGRHQGTFDIIEGTLQVENGQLEAGSFVMDINSLAVVDEGMGNEDRVKLTTHLKSGDFFESEKFPEARFELSSVKPYEAGGTAEASTASDSEFKLENPTHLVTGNLTLKDSTKSITFPARISIDANQVSAQAKFNIDRTHWGLVYRADQSFGDRMIHPEVHLSIDLMAKKNLAM
ncbi:Polyisoprenoid-binding protein YceI [Catalinimonas alkaloidigena]|uniref:Polyisoprenoid-binding protein YceI n=1 Tax=Catalinimonas alkaloidigena TaxID=1075417 RepID=A0A1G9DZR4_9BACT|nr:YceI family protein [Catalinimonas alkaloidigena]SDK69339.1 Polyisoprenoid-binding protein YceI [Catalinimonas alkaloidigena]